MSYRALAAAALAAVPLLGVSAASAAKPTAKLVDVDVVKMAAKPQAAANCSNAGAASGTYALTGWAVAGATTARLNTATVPGSLNLAATMTALQDAYDVWSTGTAAPRITVATGASVTKPTANGSYDLMWGRTSGSSLAVTYTWRWSDGRVESDTIFNTGVRWANLGVEGDGCYEGAGNVYDVGNIATHEFGHTYGLDHPSGARFETMYAYGYSGETLKRSPTPTGDLAGIADIY